MYVLFNNNDNLIYARIPKVNDEDLANSQTQSISYYRYFTPHVVILLLYYYYCYCTYGHGQNAKQRCLIKINKKISRKKSIAVNIAIHRGIGRMENVIDISSSAYSTSLFTHAL